MKTGLPEFCRAEKELSNDIYNAYEKIKKCGKISVWKKSRELMEQPNTTVYMSFERSNSRIVRKHNNLEFVSKIGWVMVQIVVTILNKRFKI